MRAILATVFLLLCAPVAAAQVLSPDANVLYVYDDLSMKTAPATDGTTEGGPLTESLTWTLTMSPALAEPAMLDLAGAIVVEMEVGGSVHVGEVDLTVELHNGATLVASGDVQHHELRTGYTVISWSLAPLVDQLDPSAGNLVATVHVEGQASSYYLDTQGSKITLPVVAPPVEVPAVNNVTIDDGRLARDFAFNVTTNRTEAITWTQGPEAANLTIAANVTAGSVNITIMDANGTAAYNALIDGPSVETTPLSGLAAGNWTVHLVFQDFVGALSLALDPTEHDDHNETPAPETNTTTPAPKDSPALGALIPLLAIVAVVAARRR